jgi:predicted transcriptional regulator of viral defense system
MVGNNYYLMVNQQVKMNELYKKYREIVVFRREDLKRDFPLLKTNAINKKIEEAKRESKVIKSIGKWRGLYFVVDPGTDYEKAEADVLLVAANIAPGAIICYLSALTAIGRSHNTSQIFQISAERPFQPLTYRGVKFVSVALPYRDLMVENRSYRGGRLLFTTPERTLVDCLRAQRHSGGFENLYNSFKSVEYINAMKIQSCLDRFNSPSLYAKTGFFLDLFKDRWRISNEILDQFRKRAPSSPDYFWGRTKGNGKLVKRWNLIVPSEILSLGTTNAG